jgi:two-component system chemotaxis sensor kinase CheA
MYVSEALEHVETINESLLKLEEEPDKKEYLDLIFRSAHTIKGMSATMGYDDTRELCKNIENIFDNIRKGQAKLTPNLASALFKCIDVLREMIADDKKTIELNPYLQMLEHPEEVQATTSESTSTTKSPTIRVKISDLDSLVNLVGELVITKMRLEQTLKGSDESHQVITDLDRLVTDLQYQSMKLRLVPIDQIFGRFTRLVRDTSTALGKEVNLVMDSSGIELDRTVLDAITDPLLHILRNCVDHGIETPQDRATMGKPTTGTIRLTAYGVGDQVAIKIEDDGKGIDLERVKQKAIENDLITEEDAEKLSDDEIINLLGTPGLSTAKEVTDVSGRGVGMDVVITQVEAVGGNVKITTQKGKGTTIVLTIPLSVSIVGGLLINVSGDKYVLPLSSISTTVVVEANQIKSIHGQEAVVLRDQVVPLIRVAKILGIGENKSNPDKITIIIIDKGGKPYGLIVDSYDRKQEIVIKRLGNKAHASDLFTNATILGDGSVALILDPTLLV